MANFGRAVRRTDTGSPKFGSGQILSRYLAQVHLTGVERSAASVLERDREPAVAADTGADAGAPLPADAAAAQRIALAHGCERLLRRGAQPAGQRRPQMLERRLDVG